jgi:hypothetical protein
LTGGVTEVRGAVGFVTVGLVVVGWYVGGAVDGPIVGDSSGVGSYVGL